MRYSAASNARRTGRQLGIRGQIRQRGARFSQISHTIVRSSVCRQPSNFNNYSDLTTQARDPVQKDYPVLG